MKKIWILLAVLLLIAGCEESDVNNKMVLLDEKINVIKVSKSKDIGDINEDILYSFEDKKSIKIFKNAITTAVKQSSDVGDLKPDYDVIVEYEMGNASHAIHLWLGEENESSTLMYIIDEEGETYVTTKKATNQLRELLLKEK